MRRMLFAFAVGAVFVLPAPASAATATVEIRRAGFAPASVTVTQNDSVSWVNRDTVNHQVVSDTGAFASPTLRPGQRYTFTFRASGQYRYRDALEPAERGTVIVRGLPPALTLAINNPIMVWGAGEMKLSGTVNSGRTGEAVTLFGQPFGVASPVQLGVVQTVANGVFEFQLHPTILTTYTAQFRGANSQPVTVQVRPRVTLLPGQARLVPDAGPRRPQLRRPLGVRAAPQPVRPVGEHPAVRARAQLGEALQDPAHAGHLPHLPDGQPGGAGVPRVLERDAARTPLTRSSGPLCSAPSAHATEKGSLCRRSSTSSRRSRPASSSRS